MAIVDVDFEVFKELTVRRRLEAMTENDVLRELLGLSPETPAGENAPQQLGAGGVPWVVKGVSFPSGTEFRATYKGQQYKGTVKNGALVMNGKRYLSPSAATVAITGNPVNGWRFWECLRPGTSRWRMISELRP